MSTNASASRILGPARLIGAFTLFSRLLGLVRDRTCSHFFGVSAVWDAFSVAFLVPNLFRRLFGEGALTAAVIPVFSDYHHRGLREEAKRVAGDVLGLLLVVLVSLLVVGEVVVGLIWLLGDGDGRTALTLRLTALMLPFLVLICTTAMLGGLLNVVGHFATPAATPAVMNVCIITAVAGAWHFTGAPPERLIYFAAGAVLLAGVLQLGLHWIAIRRRAYAITLSFDYRHEAVGRILRAMGPMVLGLGAVQFNTFADSLIAYWLLSEGAPGVLYFAHRLYDFPLGVFGVALATAAFAELSRLASRGEMQAFGATVQKGMQLVLLVGMPASAGMILVREPLVSLVYESGTFTAADTQRVAFALLFYATGIWAFGCQHVLIRAFYARKNTKTPLRVAVVMVLVNLPLNVILVLGTPLAEGGLALATSICAVIQVVWLARLLARQVEHVCWKAIWRSAMRTAAATVAMVVGVALLAYVLPAGTAVAVRLGVLVAAGVATFVAAGWLCGHADLKELITRTTAKRPS